jgi:hypothetical protein
MFNDNPLDIEKEMTEIPAEYQEIFRQALEQELAESEQNRTDQEILRYLRRRRSDFQGGGFIRPDGRPGLLTLSPEALYEQALPELAQNSLGEADDAEERRRTLVKSEFSPDWPCCCSSWPCAAGPSAKRPGPPGTGRRRRWLS